MSRFHPSSPTSATPSLDSATQPFIARASISTPTPRRPSRGVASLGCGPVLGAVDARPAEQRLPSLTTVSVLDFFQAIPGILSLNSTTSTSTAATLPSGLAPANFGLPWSRSWPQTNGKVPRSNSTQCPNGPDHESDECVDGRTASAAHGPSALSTDFGTGTTQVAPRTVANSGRWSLVLIARCHPLV